jgi:hypothetical protein
MKDIIISVIGSRSTEPEDEDEDSHAVNGRVAGIELLLSVLTRLRNQNIYNFFTIVLSLLALASNLSSNMWRMLNMMSLLFSKSWTVELAK